MQDVSSYWTMSKGYFICRTFLHIGHRLRDISYVGSFVVLVIFCGVIIVQNTLLYWARIFSVCDVSTLFERYLVSRMFRYVGHCLWSIYCIEHFVILDRETFSKCDLFLFWKLSKRYLACTMLIILGTEVCLLHKTLHCIRHTATQFT